MSVCALPNHGCFISNGRTTKVGAAMVVPTKAATISLPPGTDGIDGTKPFTMSDGGGRTINIEIIKEIPMIVTKITSIFSKNEYLPTNSIPYNNTIRKIAIPRTAQ